jgi:hypothetical protein
MDNLLSDIKDADIYIDDGGAFSSNWDHQINLLTTILRQLRENGFTIKPLNSLTAIGPYLPHRFCWALFKVNNFLNFCPLTMFDSSKCGLALQLK